MAAQSNLTLNSKVYEPRGNINGIAKWTFTGDTTFGGASSSVTESVREPTSGGSVSRVKFKLDIPKAASQDSACSCSGEFIGDFIANVDVAVPRSFTQAERADACARLQALVADAIFSDAVSDLTGSW